MPVPVATARPVAPPTAVDNGGVDVLPVAQRLKALASVSGNQAYIARKGVLPTLLKFLRHEQLEVQLTAAETLRLLTGHAENPKLMAEDADLVREVGERLARTRDGGDRRLLRELEAVSSALRPVLPKEMQGMLDAGVGAVHGEARTAEYGAPTRPGRPGGATPVDARSVYTTARSVYPSVQQEYRRELVTRRAHTRSTRPLRNIIVRCHGLTEDRKDDCEHILRHVRGVVSYSISGQDVHMFASTPTHALHLYLTECEYAPEIIHESQPAPTARGGNLGGSAASVHADTARALVGKGKVKDHTERPRRDKNAKDRSAVVEFFQNLGRSLFS